MGTTTNRTEHEMTLEDLKALFVQHPAASLTDYTVEGDTITATKICTITGEPYSVQMPLADYTAWKHGELIHNALPQLTPTQRAFLTSGATPAELAYLPWEND